MSYSRAERSVRDSDALLAHGRPETVKLLVLVDRRFQRELPIEPQFIGKSIDSIDWQYVQVDMERDNATTCRVMLLESRSPNESPVRSTA